MSAHRGCVLAIVVSLVPACAKQAPRSASPDAQDDSATGTSASANDAGDPVVRLAQYEAELAARRAELAAGGVDLSGSEELREGPAKAQRQTKKAGKDRRKNESRATSGQPATKPTARTPARDVDEVDACARICEPAAAICGLRDHICELAQEHEDEPRFTDACERAEDDCERATEACEDCRG